MRQKYLTDLIDRKWRGKDRLTSAGGMAGE